MNERIEKLIEQCTVQEFSDCTGGFETFDKQKFAELIVKECVQVLDPGEHQLIARFQARKMLEEHFGVE